MTHPHPHPHRRLLATAALLLLALLHCDDHVRTEAFDTENDTDTAAFDLFDVSVGAVEPDYMAPIAPDCGPGPIQIGEVRTIIDGAAGRAAIGPDGRIYLPTSAAEGAINLSAFDPCGELLWSTPAIPPQSAQAILKPHARLTTSHVWLTNSDGNGHAYGIWCTDLQGTPCTLDLGDHLLSVFIGVTESLGALAVTYDAAAKRNQLKAYQPSGEVRVLSDGLLPSGWPCVIDGDWIACWGGVYPIAGGAPRWTRETELIDGTVWYILSPAVDSSQIVSLIFGISSYFLTSRSLADGSERFRIPLGPSSAGQTSLLAGRPVIGYDGEIYTYLHVERAARPYGLLYAFDRDGGLRWTYAADVQGQDFTAEATHVVGRDGVVYLAADSVVTALSRDGAPLWEAFLKGTFSDSGPVLSPNGDLGLTADEGFFFLLATTSAGPALSPWPGPGGDSSNRNARP